MLSVPAVGGERLGELAGEDGVDHLLLLLPDGGVYPAARGRLCPHGHQAAPGPGRLRDGGRGDDDDGEAARGGAERGRHGWLSRLGFGLVWWCGRGSRAGWMMMARVLEVGGGGVCVAAWGGFAVCGGHTSRGGQVERCETGRMHWWVVAAAAARADGARTATAIKSGRACDRAGRQPLCCWLHARMHAAGPAALMGAVTYTRAGRSSVVERDADAAWVGGPGAQQRRGTKKA